MDLAELSVASVVRAIAAGEITSEELVRACLARIDQREADVQAWMHLDPDHALGQARAADDARREGRTLGPLHGVPLGIKDVFDTADMPTEDGTPLHAGRRPLADATAVALLRQAGAVILGKTVTTELAVYGPGKTRNPHDPAHTPGGSSSGSAAAVAAGMVPAALGSQTNGSVIRPAAYCGVCGYKPTFGLISRRGALAQSRPLDHVGVFARTVEDLALVAETLIAFDAGDGDTRPRARPHLGTVVLEEPPVEPRLAFVKTPMWDQAEATTREAFAELVEHLAGVVAEVSLSHPFYKVVGWHRTIMFADLAKSFAAEYERGRDRLSDTLRGIIEEGQKVLAVDYNLAVERIPAVNAALNEVFARYDAILTPATTGEAPRGLESTGSPIFCTIWTYSGTPAVTLPLLEGPHGLPLGVQLVAARGNDARLLRTAHWLVERVTK